MQHDASTCNRRGVLAFGVRESLSRLALAPKRVACQQRVTPCALEAGSKVFECIERSAIAVACETIGKAYGGRHCVGRGDRLVEQRS
jgi:hypothetical protein